MNINVFRDRLVSTLGENLACLIHMGSRVRGEARADSDFDFALVLSEIDKSVLDGIRDVISDLQLEQSDISLYILDKQELDSPELPAEHLQFVYSEIIYGGCIIPKPSAEDIDTFVNMTRSEEKFAFRHYLIFPHNTKKLVRRIALSLKYAYFCLTYLVYKETGILPKTRIETINYLQKKDSSKLLLPITILKILEDWSVQETLATKKPRKYLHMLEEFWRTLELG